MSWLAVLGLLLGLAGVPPIYPVGPPVPPPQEGPVAVHYPPHLMDRVATRNQIPWQRVAVGGAVYYRIRGVLYAGLASTPLCPSATVGGSIQAEVYNRRTSRWEAGRFYQADVSQAGDRDAQLTGQRLLELDWDTMAALGATVAQGWGRTPVRAVQPACPRRPS